MTLIFNALKVEFDCKLYNSRVVAGRDDFSEIAGTARCDLTCVWINFTAGLSDGVEVTDRIGEVDVVHEIEKLGTEFDVFCFVKAEALAN